MDADLSGPGAWLKLLRPKQWTKNLLAFAALIFTDQVGPNLSTQFAVLAFVALCLLSSGSYALNDALDFEKDRLHPRKAKRPVASGAIDPFLARGAAVFLFFMGLGLAAWVSLSTLVAAGAFLAVQLAYNLLLKPIPVADVMGIAAAFVLRAVVGAVAISAAISPWLLYCTACLALLLGFAKRRHEFQVQAASGTVTRESLKSYTLPALDMFVVFSASLAAMSYLLYVIEGQTALAHPNLVYTAIPVLYAVMRYLFVVFVSEEGGEPESLLLEDRHLLLSIAAFLALAIWAMKTGAP